MATTEWITRRSYLQISRSQVLPVVFKSEKTEATLSQKSGSSVPPSFPPSSMQLSDALDVIKEWLLPRLERLHRRESMNLKRGALETPDVIKNGKYMITIWLEPTAASYAVLSPTASFAHEDQGNQPDNEKRFDGYEPTAQTLHVVGELVESP